MSNEKHKFSKQVHFTPFIGENYFSSTPKVLILGESVYKKEDEKKPGKNVAKKMIHGISTHEWNNSFFTRIQDMFSNEDDYNKIDDETYELSRALFWQRSAFYEYIQEPLEGVRTRPSEDQWANAQEPFLEVIEYLIPDIIIVLGNDNYKHLPNIGSNAKNIKIKNDIMEVWKYNIKEKTSYVCKVQHPSSFGFKKQKWMDLYEKFLKEYKF